MLDPNNIFLIGNPEFYSDPQKNMFRSEIWDDYESMNEDLISYWNETVNKDNIVYIICGKGGIENSFFKNKLNEKLNGEIILIQNKNSSIPKYYNHFVSEAEFVHVKAIDLNIQYTIYLTNFLEHINRVEANFTVTSCLTNNLKKVNEKFIYYESKEGSHIFVNNLNKPVFNLSADLWEFKPVRLSTLLEIYKSYCIFNSE